VRFIEGSSLLRLKIFFHHRFADFKKELCFKIFTDLKFAKNYANKIIKICESVVVFLKTNALDLLWIIK
jgi:hypothetical protein